jgi:hypothetical protein
MAEKLLREISATVAYSNPNQDVCLGILLQIAPDVEETFYRERSGGSGLFLGEAFRYSISRL